jgi:hypothetical protein
MTEEEIGAAAEADASEESGGSDFPFEMYMQEIADLQERVSGLETESATLAEVGVRIADRLEDAVPLMMAGFGAVFGACVILAFLRGFQNGR